MASTALASTQAQAATPTPIGAPAVSGDPAVAPTTSSGLIRRSGSANDEAADLARAYELSNRGRSAEAIEMLQHALRVWPQHHESRNALATLLSEGGQPGAALSVLLEGAALEPGRFALNAARLQAEAQQPENALQTLAKVPDAQRDALYHALVAAIAQRAGRSDQAITEFQAALQAGPPRALWYVGLGATLERLERRADALAAYRQALALGGASPAAAEFAGQRVAALATQTLGTGAAPTAATATRASEAR
jgi:Flp pilus assembly protein TadD